MDITFARAGTREVFIVP